MPKKQFVTFRTVILVFIGLTLFVCCAAANNPNIGTKKPAAPDAQPLAPAIATGKANDTGATPIPAPTAVAIPTATAAPAAPAVPSGGNYGGSVNGYAPVDAFTCPDYAPIKGNKNSMIYHRPGQSAYGKTKPEVCFARAEDAEASGFRAAKR